MGDAVVVGAGFAGVLASRELLRGGWRVLLVDPGARAGRGLAYSTNDPWHLLNSPAATMSVEPDDPGDFVAWCRGRDAGIGPGDFVSRQWYGDYLSAALGKADALGDLTVHSGRVVRIFEGDRMVALLDNDVVIKADQVVLAVGNAPPARPFTVDPQMRHFVDDPWKPAALQGLPAGPVTLIGSGLTAVDVALTLARSGRHDRITMVSRHGMLPRVHAASKEPSTQWAHNEGDQPSSPQPRTDVGYAAGREPSTQWAHNEGDQPSSPQPRTDVGYAAGREPSTQWAHNEGDQPSSPQPRTDVGYAAGRQPSTQWAHNEGDQPSSPQPRTDVGYAAGRRIVIDRPRQRTLSGLIRGVRQLIEIVGDWRAVMDGLRPHWNDMWRDLSPADQERFLRHAARLWEVHRHRMAPAVAAEIERLRERGVLEIRRGRVEAVPAGETGVVNCTGPGSLVRTDPLTRSLIADGLAQPGPYGLGIDVDEHGTLIRPGGNPSSIHTLGAARKGHLWETTAAPEIRAQARALAVHLLSKREPSAVSHHG